MRSVPSSSETKISSKMFCHFSILDSELLVNVCSLHQPIDASISLDITWCLNPSHKCGSRTVTNQPSHLFFNSIYLMRCCSNMSGLFCIFSLFPKWRRVQLLCLIWHCAFLKLRESIWVSTENCLFSDLLWKARSQGLQLLSSFQLSYTSDFWIWDCLKLWTLIMRGVHVRGPIFCLEIFALLKSSSCIKTGEQS